MARSIKNLFFSAALFVPAVLWRSFAAVKIYGWYAQLGWPILSLRDAVGIFMVMTLLAPVGSKHSSAEEVDHVTVMMNLLIGPLLALLFGFILKEMIT